MTQGKKAATHVVGLVLALSLFAYCGKMASHAGANHPTLLFWGSFALGGLVAALVLASMISATYGREAAAHPRPRFAPLLRRTPKTNVVIAKLT